MENFFQLSIWGRKKLKKYPEKMGQKGKRKIIPLDTLFPAFSS